MSRLIRRVLVGAVLIAVVVVAIFLHQLLLAVLLGVWIFLASMEYTDLLRRQGIALARWLLPALNLVLPAVLVLDFALLSRTSSNWHWQAILLVLSVVFGYTIFARAPRAPRLAYASFGVIYLSLLPAHLMLLKQHTLEQAGMTPWIVFFPLLATWVNDTGAYGFGKWLGRHKLSPEISPNKTWEGFALGVLVTIVFSAVYLHYSLPHLAVLHRIVLGFLLGIVAQAGDLVESAFKREARVKDSSSALSEHGGFLDRADSLLFTIPLFYYYLLIFARPLT